MLNKYSWNIDFLFLIFFLGSLFFILLGSRPLSIPDEGNYAEIAREMFVTHDYLTPYLNGIKFFEKPIFLYWLGAGFFKLFGMNLWALRSVNASIALLGCILTYITARQLYDRITGLLAASILGTSMLYFILAHMYTMDLTVSVFMALSLFTFILGVRERNFPQIFYFALCAMGMALAVLTKGLMGIVLPLLVMGTWVAFYREWKLVRFPDVFFYITLFAFIAVPWHGLVSLHHPEFLHFYFMEHHFSRFSSGEVGHLRPFWYYIPVVVLGLFPWVIFLPSAIIQIFSFKNRKNNKVEVFLGLYALIIFLFFSISKAKLIPYVLPIFPPLAILIARYLRKAQALRKHFAMLLIFSCVLALGCLLFTSYWQVENVQVSYLYLKTTAVILLLGSAMAYYFSRHHRDFSIIITILMGGALGLMLMAALPKMDRLSILPLTNILKPQLRQTDEVVAFNHHFQDLSFYLERKVNILNSRKLFAFGMAHQKNHEWMINDKKFIEDWLGPKRVFAIMDIEHYENIPARYKQLTFHLWGKTSRNVLVSNMPT